MLDFRTIFLQAAALLLPAWLQRQSLDRARDGLGVSVPGALVEVFIECKVLHSWFGSLVCPVPGCSREAAGTATGCQEGNCNSSRGSQRVSSREGSRKPKATWEAKVPAGKGSTVPEVNVSAAALPEVQPSAAGVVACWAPSAAAAPGTAAGSSRAGGKPAEGAG